MIKRVWKLLRIRWDICIFLWTQPCPCQRCTGQRWARWALSRTENVYEHHYNTVHTEPYIYIIIHFWFNTVYLRYNIQFAYDTITIPKGILEGEMFLFDWGNFYFVIWKCFIYSNFWTGMVKIIVIKSNFSLLICLYLKICSSLLREDFHTCI